MDLMQRTHLTHSIFRLSRQWLLLSFDMRCLSPGIGHHWKRRSYALKLLLCITPTDLAVDRRSVKDRPLQGSLYTNVHAHSSFGLQTTDECRVAYSFAEDEWWAQPNIREEGEQTSDRSEWSTLGESAALG